MQHAYIPRHIGAKITRLFGHFPAVVVSGARQVGKSTLLEKLFPDIPRVVFDTVIDIEGAKSDPDLFLRNRFPPIILDEIQYVPELVSAIKRSLDKKTKNGQFLITGSQQWEVMKRLSESLAGRAAFVDLDGFSLYEITETAEGGPWLKRWLDNPQQFKSDTVRQLDNKFSLYEQLWRGFLPETFFLPRDIISDFFHRM